MHRANHREHCFTYLFGEEPRIVPLTRRDDSEVQVSLGVQPPQTHVIRYDMRDQRALVLFDGDIPWQALPKSADEVFREELQCVFRQHAYIRRNRPCEERMPHQSLVDNDFGRILRIVRHGILMPAAIACVRRYRHENLTARYSLLTVRRALDNTEVEWTNSSY